MSAEHFLARLDGAPLVRAHWTLAIAVGIGSLLALLDWQLLAVPATAAAAPIGLLAGAVIGGWSADRAGRRPVLVWTLPVLSLATAIALVAPVNALVIAGRAVASAALATELVVGAVYLAEVAPRARRGLLVISLALFAAVGALAGDAIVAGLLPLVGAIVIAALIALSALLVMYLRSALPETPRYLALRGRATEADAVVRRIERGGGAPLITVARVQAPPPAMAIARMTRRGFTLRTAALWLAWLAVGVAAALDARALQLGSLSRGELYAAAIAAIVGVALAAWLADAIGRRPLLAIALAGLALAAVAAAAGAPALLRAALAGSFGAVAAAVLVAYAAELYPTPLRGAAAGVTYGVGRLFAVVPLLVVAYAPLGASAPLVVVAVAAVLAAIAVWTLCDETRGRSLEDVSAA